MAMRGQQRMLDHVTDQLHARQLAGVQVAPLRQVLTGGFVVATVQRVADVREVVAELAEAEREVEHQHVHAQRQQHMDVKRQGVRAGSPQRLAPAP